MKVEKLRRKEEDGYAIIKCGTCLLEERYPAGPLTDPVDVYGMLVDQYYGETSSAAVDQTPIKEVSLLALKAESDEAVQKEKAPVKPAPTPVSAPMPVPAPADEPIDKEILEALAKKDLTDEDEEDDTFDDVFKDADEKED